VAWLVHVNQIVPVFVGPRRGPGDRDDQLGKVHKPKKGLREKVQGWKISTPTVEQWLSFFETCKLARGRVGPGPG
jgi:hypothetical protein